MNRGLARCDVLLADEGFVQSLHHAVQAQIVMGGIVRISEPVRTRGVAVATEVAPFGWQSWR
jgi:hypothetical protein